MNNDGFTKLFSSILTSSIWSEDDKTRILWITLLACTDSDGYCSGSVPGLAALSRLTTEDTAKAIAKLEAPDKFSRTTAHEGRRLQKVEGGWLVLNYSLYRDRERTEKRKEYMRELMRTRRSGGLLTGANEVLTDANPSVSVSVSASSPCKGIVKGGFFHEPTQAEKEEAIFTRYNEVATAIGLPKVTILSDARRRKISARLKEYPERKTWDALFAMLEKSTRLADPECKWFSFDWMVKSTESFDKVARGWMNGTGFSYKPQTPRNFLADDGSPNSQAAKLRAQSIPSTAFETERE
jgi:hypothetical protein